MSHIIQSNGFARQRAVRVAGERRVFFHPCLAFGVCVCAVRVAGWARVVAAPNGKYKMNLVEVFNVCIVLVFHFNVIESPTGWLAGWLGDSIDKKESPSGHDTCFPHFLANCLHTLTHTPSNVNHSENIGYTLSIIHICFLRVSFLPHSVAPSNSCRTFHATTINSSFHTTLW